MTAMVIGGAVPRIQRSAAMRVSRRAHAAGPVLVTFGALAIAAAGVAASVVDARTSTGPMHFAVFWASFLSALAVVTWVGTRPTLPDASRLAVLVGFAAFTFLPKLFESFSHPVFFDEYPHLRHARDILATGDVLSPNSALPIVRYYPGLALSTDAVHGVTRLSLWHSGQVVIGAAHVFALIGIFLLARTLGASGRASFAAAIVYALNPSFVFFDTQYGYESLAISLAIWTMLGALRARTATTRSSCLRWATGGVAAGLGTVTTHHLSAAVAVVAAVTIAAVVPVPTAFEGPERSVRRAAGWVVAGVTSLGLAGWVSTVASVTWGYISPHVSTGLSQAIDLFGNDQRSSTVAGHTIVYSAAHTPFNASAAPFYERAAAFLAPVVALVVMICAVIAVRRSGRSRTELRPLVPFAVLALLYFVSVPFALTAGGSEGAHRSWAFSYIGLAVLAPLAAPVVRTAARARGEHWWVGRTHGAAAGAVLAAAAIGVVAVGNIAAGENVSYRFPGPYTFGSDTRAGSAELDGVVAWAQQNLPAGSNVITDRFTGEAVEGYTDLNVPGPSQSAAFGIYQFGGEPSQVLRTTLRTLGFSYFILDKRALTQLPREHSLFQGYLRRIPVLPDAIAKLGSTPFSALLHETTNYAVYALHP